MSWKKKSSDGRRPPTVDPVSAVPIRAVDVPPETTDPIELIEACRKGDRTALETVLRPLVPAIERLLARLVPEPADVEDLLQNTLAAAIAAFPRFRGEATVKTWLARIATCQVQEHWRSPARRRRAALEVVDGDLVAPGRADAQAEARRRLDRLYEHLAAIAPKKRIAFVLHVIDGRPIEEVAAITGATVTATRSRVLWGRRALMARMRRDPLLAELVTEGTS